MGICCWKIGNADEGEQVDKKLKKQDKIQSRQTNFPSGQRHSFDCDDFERMFSFYKRIKKCDELVKQFVMKNSTQSERGKFNNDQCGKNDENSQNQKYSQAVDQEIKRLKEYLSLLQTFIKSEFYHHMQHLLNQFFNRDKKQMIQRNILVDDSQLNKLIETLCKESVTISGGGNQEKDMICRMVKDVLMLTLINVKLSNKRQLHIQESQKLSLILNQFHKQHSRLQSQSSKSQLESLQLSLSKINSSQDSSKYFLVKMRVKLILHEQKIMKQASKTQSNKESSINQFHIKLITTNYSTKQKNEIVIGTYQLNSIEGCQKDSDNKISKSINQKNTFNLQFAVTPDTVIKFETYPQKWTCSLSTNQFLSRLYAVDIDFDLFKSQEQKHRNDININTKNNLNQNLLTPQQNIYNAENPQILITLQPIPSYFPQYFQKLKKYTKSVLKTLQAISSNSPLPLDFRSSFASNTSYTESFAFSENKSQKSRSCFGC